MALQTANDNKLNHLMIVNVSITCTELSLRDSKIVNFFIQESMCTLPSKANRKLTFASDYS